MVFQAGESSVWAARKVSAEAHVWHAFGSRFWAFLSHCLTIFCCAREAKNIVKYNVFVLLAYRNYILQHGENCVNTSVFARHGHKNTVNTVMFATRGKKNVVNTVVLGFRGT